MNREPNIGNQTTYFEPPEIIFLKLRGGVTRAEGLEINERHLQWGTAVPRVFLLIDLSELDSIDPEVRKVATKTLAAIPLRGMVGYNAPIKAKVIAKLIFTALNMFSNKAERIPLHFTADEAQAREWIEQRRQEIDAENQAAAAAEGTGHGK